MQCNINEAWCQLRPRPRPGQINTRETVETEPDGDQTQPAPGPCRHCRSPPHCSGLGSVYCACSEGWHWIDCWWLRSWQSQGQDGWRGGLVVIRWSWDSGHGWPSHTASDQWPVLRARKSGNIVSMSVVTRICVLWHVLWHTGDCEDEVRECWAKAIDW